MTWEPLIDVVGSGDAITVSASDVASRDDDCRLHLAFKIRRALKARAWQRSFGNIPFVLRPIRDIVIEFHNAAPRLASYTELATFLDEKMSRRTDIPRALRRYVRRALENYADAHEALEGVTGAMRVLAVDPTAGTPNRQLTAWAVLLVSDDGLLELRRLRMGGARDGSAPEDQRYAALAARVATAAAGNPAAHIRIVEVGLGDGSTSVILDVDGGGAREQFSSLARPKIDDFVNATGKRPGFRCGDCKVAGCCDALVALPGVLGQPHGGVASRSVSASDLRIHDLCPTQYLLTKIAYLPRAVAEASDAQERGRAIHDWLKAAHGRGTRCTNADLPHIDDYDEQAGFLSADDYTHAYPYLLWHLEHCLLEDPDTHVLLVDEPMYGFDSDAQVVVASKPDLVAIAGTELIVRETKSTDRGLPTDSAEAFDQYFEVAWLLTLAAGGVAAHFGANTARVELEILTPSSSALHIWRTTDSQVLAMAKGEVSRRVAKWHVDDQWVATPGPHCGWCPVQEWCPDADTGAVAAQSPVDNQDDDDDEPPF